METWIKLNKIKYENVYSIKFSKKGQIPYIELNGEQVADSNIIIPKLKVINVFRLNIYLLRTLFLYTKSHDVVLQPFPNIVFAGSLQSQSRYESYASRKCHYTCSYHDA